MEAVAPVVLPGDRGRSTRLQAMAKKMAAKRRPVEANTTAESTLRPVTEGSLVTESSQQRLPSESTLSPGTESSLARELESTTSTETSRFDENVMVTTTYLVDATPPSYQDTTVHPQRLAGGETATEAVPLITPTDSTDEMADGGSTLPAGQEIDEAELTGQDMEAGDLEMNDSVEPVSSDRSAEAAEATEEEDEENLILETKGIEIPKEAWAGGRAPSRPRRLYY